ncbi:MAG: methyltransferase domain-containing protein [Candidatus Hydrogenedentes bacterium]|nr:methyltransferase domain-containing protein [Candidatus Hydrogenedentota bacterium]
MPWKLSERVCEPEILDRPDLDPEDVLPAYRGLARLHRIANATRIFLEPLQAYLRRDDGERTIRVLDLACGDGHLIRQLYRRLAEAHPHVEFYGCDKNVHAIEHANEQAVVDGCEGLHFFEANIIDEPIPPGFDVYINSLFLHHLDTPVAIQFMRNLAACAPDCILLSDLLRTHRGVVLTALATHTFSRSPIVHIDGRRSIRAAFSASEVRGLMRESGWNGVTLSRHWPERFLLTWRNPFA